MRIVMISKACVVGSYQTKLERMAAYEDVDLTVIVPPSWREGGHELTLERAHIQGYAMRALPLCLNGSFHLHFYRGLGTLLRELAPDLVHMDEEPYNLATYLAFRAARAVGAKCLFFTWQNLHRRYPWPFAATERYVHRNASGAIAGNSAAADVLRAKGYAGPLVVIPQFGVDPELFSPPEARGMDGPVIIGYAGRIVPEKGLWVLVEALEGLTGSWELHLAGQGPLEPALRDRLRRSGLDERVRFLGYVPSGDMPTVLSAMDILVLPSLTRRNWVEQFGRVLIEAMACAVAVVGSDSGEIPRVIGDSGLVVPEGDAEALRTALESLVGDPAARQRLGNRGRSRVMTHFTQAQIAARIVSFYRELQGSEG
ncbi:MAG: glycosyltransferase family 4 protein [Anaerolineae bacterium]